MTAPKIDSNHFFFSTDASTCTIKATAGTLVRVLVGGGGALTGTMSIKDNATVIFAWQASAVDGPYPFGVHFDESLVLVHGNDADDICVVYR